MDRDSLERLRTLKRKRPFNRLKSKTTVEYEYQREDWGHPSTYAYVKFDCVPADDLSFEMVSSWPEGMDKGDAARFELAVAEALADILLDGAYQHSGCAITLVEVRQDDVGSSQVAFMVATKNAMQELLKAEWTFVLRE